MNIRMIRAVLAATFMAIILLVPALTAQTRPLRAGAGKVDITPDANALPPTYTSIRDPLYARAIVFDNGRTRAAVINADLGNIMPTTVDEVTRQAAALLDAPVANILISATHDHNAIFESGPNAAQTAPDSKSIAENEKITSGMVQAVRAAKANLQEARIGFGTGLLYLNANRDAIDPNTRLWAQEPNLDYPSDKTLAVIKVEATSGALIAVYMNYAMHATSTFLSGEVSGEFPGAAARYIEHRYHDKAVAIWTTGAAGDQNPRYSQVEQRISDAKIDSVIQAHHMNPTDVGAALMIAMFAGDPAADKTPIDPLLLEEGHMLIQSEGFYTAEEAIWVMEHMNRMVSDVEISGAQNEITCPARRRLDNGREGQPGRYEDSPDPVHIQIGALVIGDIALAHSSSEAYTLIGLGVKERSKYKNTLFVTLTNNVKGGGGYMPSDDAFGRNTFEVLGTRLKPGCAETGIIDGISGMLDHIGK